jgi:hypothetical protein
VTEEIKVGPQANFTLLDQMSELKKAQSNRKKQNFFFENLIFSN